MATVQEWLDRGTPEIRQRYHEDFERVGRSAALAMLKGQVKAHEVTEKKRARLTVQLLKQLTGKINAFKLRHADTPDLDRIAIDAARELYGVLVPSSIVYQDDNSGETYDAGSAVDVQDSSTPAEDSSSEPEEEDAVAGDLSMEDPAVWGEDIDCGEDVDYGEDVSDDLDL